MTKKIIVATIAFLAITLSISHTQAQEQEGLYYYLLPPSGLIEINDELLTNNSKENGMMVFRKREEETLLIGQNTKGVQIVSKSFKADMAAEVKLYIKENIELLSGSIHVMTLAGSTEITTIKVGKLFLNFHSAEFLAYVSGNQAETIIKVIGGEVEIVNYDTEQTAIVTSQQSTSTDDTGRLLIPSPFEIREEQKWWESREYIFNYESLPIANAGEDQRVLGNIPVVLNGSKSHFKTGDIFEWTLVKGPKDQNGAEVNEVAFDSTNIVKPLFTPVIDGEYQFTLQITDENDEKSNADNVLIFVGQRYLRPITIFPDVPADHVNNIAITYLYKKGVMKGSEDPATGKVLFRPEDIINRVEILKTIFENKGQKIPTEEELRSLEEEIFEDVKPEHWFAPYVYLAKKQGIVKGNNGLYRPADQVLLVEALKIIIKAYQISLDTYEDQISKPYEDTEVGAWYNPYLFFVKKYNLFDADANGNINPGQALTRAKFAEIIYRMESINLFEKRGFLSGVLKDETSKEGVPDAEIYVYQALEDNAGLTEETTGFVKKGELLFKTKTNNDGSFTVSLTINSKYYIEAVSGDNVSSKKIVTEVEEDQTTSIELEILTD